MVSPVFCSLVHRDKAGSLWLTSDGYIKGNNANIGKTGTSGIDFGTSYSMKLAGYGSLNLSFNGTLLRTLTTENVPGLGEYDCAGYFGQTCGTPNPKWRHKIRANWTTPWNVDIAGTWRYFASLDQDVLSTNPLLNGTANPLEKLLMHATTSISMLPML